MLSYEDCLEGMTDIFGSESKQGLREMGLYDLYLKWHSATGSKLRAIEDEMVQVYRDRFSC